MPRNRFQFRRIQIMADKPMKVPGPDHPVSIDANPSRVVVTVGGRVIADTHDVRSSSKGAHWLEVDGGEVAEPHPLGTDEQRSDHYAPPHKQRFNTDHAG
jgi:hypothetical protein